MTDDDRKGLEYLIKNCHGDDPTIHEVGAALAEIDRLRAELEAERAKASADSRRLDWMERYRANTSLLLSFNGPPTHRVYYWTRSGGDTARRIEGPTLRDAIDVGMRATEGGS